MARTKYRVFCKVPGTPLNYYSRYALQLFPVISLLLVCVHSHCYGLNSNQYLPSSRSLNAQYPEKYKALYEKVKSHFTQEQFDRVMSRKEGIELDERHKEKLVFMASPNSVEMQKQQHIDWIPLLVNEETLNNGREFFKAYTGSLKSAYEKTGVAPRDIISILNWESKLGEKKGTYKIFNLFVGYYFYIDAIEKELFNKGAYAAKDAMPRDKALKRINRIKQRALINLSQLLIQSKVMGFDPFQVQGSWAGAIGLPQFMPESMKFARDGDGDGTIDLNTVPDAIMSVAFYLKLNGYHDRGRKYAFMRYNAEEVYVQGVMLYSQKISALGVKPLTGWTYP